MLKLTSFALFTTLAAAQTATNPFDKAPANVEQALRSRVSEFYQDHIESKFRKAEPLVAEDSKDAFYAANKPVLDSFKIGPIYYSDNFKKAKVTVVGKMMINFIGMPAPQMTDVPFPSYWKLERGKWCWYASTDRNPVTPFGKVQPGSKAASGTPTDPAAAFTRMDLATIAKSIEVDRKAIKLPRTTGAEESVSITNHLAGTIQLAFDAPSYPGLEVKLDKTELKQGEKAVVSIKTAEEKNFLTRVVRVLVNPINQVVDIQVSF